ncbi:MAG: hypothetical protein IJW11_00900 [Clostridia bacterium]|nr:hypothetical protein [Clostridia bacterium]
MKRVIALLLCLVLACGMLVSCGDTEIGAHADDLKQQFYIPPEEKISLKLYVVYDEADSGALTEVERRINAWTESEYNTKLDVVYLTADEYDAKAVTANENEDAIVLVTSKDMMDDLYGNGKDVTVTELYDVKQATADAPVVKVVTKYNADGTVDVKKYNEAGEIVDGTDADAEKEPVSRQVSVGHLEDLSEYVLKTDAQYALLNAKIAESFMDCAMLDYTMGESATGTGLFAIPNNRLIGGTNGYKYVQIDRQVCEIWLNHTEEYLAGIDTEEEIAALKNEIVTELGYTPDKADTYVKVVNGNYATKATLEAGEKYILNVIESPVVDAEMVFEGAFAVLAGTDVERAMRIIYAINMDSTLHNLLQYGIKDTNYTLDANGVATAITAEGKFYQMNPLYTGNLFSVHFSETWNWTPAVKEYAEAQNLAADKLYSDLKAAN